MESFECKFSDSVMYEQFTEMKTDVFMSRLHSTERKLTHGSFLRTLRVKKVQSLFSVVLIHLKNST